MKRSLFVFLAVGFAAARVLAHSTLDHSEPKNSATLKQSPNEIRMWFTEPFKTSLSTIEVRDASGKQVDRADLRADEKKPALVRVTLLPNLGPGVYKVTWNAVAQDMHVSKGAFSFQLAPK